LHGLLDIKTYLNVIPSLSVVPDPDVDAVMLAELSNVTLDVLHDLAVRATRHVQQPVDVAADREAPLKTHRSRSLEKSHF
jgi:hypothetical protein